MKVRQNVKFEPVTITLETEKEANDFIKIIDNVGNIDTILSPAQVNLVNKISDQWGTEVAKF